MANLRRTAALMAGVLSTSALLAAPTVHAKNISLRVDFAEGRNGAVFTPSHAEIGTFAVTPDVRQGAADGQWRVLAKDGQGRILHEVTVSKGQRRHPGHLVWPRRAGAIGRQQQGARQGGAGPCRHRHHHPQYGHGGHAHGLRVCR